MVDDGVDPLLLDAERSDPGDGARVDLTRQALEHRAAPAF
jgi:hypothetical protein